GGLLQSLPKGAVHICAGTHSVDCIQKLNKLHGDAGQVLLATPMLGRPQVVDSGQAGMVLGCAIEAMGEGFALVRKYDVVPDVLYDVLTDGLFACSAYKIYGKIITEERYLPAGQRAILGLKDANFALEAGGAVGVPLPSGNVWRDRLVGAVAHGEGEHDWAVMAKDQARASGLS